MNTTTEKPSKIGEKHQEKSINYRHKCSKMWFIPKNTDSHSQSNQIYNVIKRAKAIFCEIYLISSK